MSYNFNEELGRRIRAAREGKLTQAALGASVGLSRTAITNIECGRQRLLVDQLVGIAGAIGVPAADLLPQSPVQDSRIDDEGVEAMPAVQRFLTSMKRTSARGAR